MTTRLPVLLENLRIATPCQADWDDMAGDDRVRFCGRCEKNVYNLSAMTRDEAQALVGDREGRMCVRLYQRTDGTVLTADCPVGVRRERLRARIWARVSGVAASAALLVGLWSGRARADLTVDGKKVTATKPPAPSQPQQQAAIGTVAAPEPVPLMGKVAYRPEPPPKKQPVMGEPAPIMGDIAVVTPKAPTHKAPTK
ncbi:MAG: hypothetical protein JWM53_1467 [bacterium]|nr:hypothetical protein [bacterium]